MRYLLWLLVAVPLTLLECGCSKPVVVGSKDTARAMKQATRNLVARAKENPKAGARQAEALGESLQALAHKGTDENRSIYEEMANKCKEIADLSDRPGGSDVTKKLDELVALANKLPGTLEEPGKPEGAPVAQPKARVRYRD
jgi:hypothetical protein